MNRRRAASLAGGDDADADCLVRRGRTRVARRQDRIMLDGGERDECVVDRAARDSRLSKQLGQLRRGSRLEMQMRCETRPQEPGSIRRRNPQITRQPREHRIRLGDRMPTDRYLTTSPPTHDRLMRAVGLNQQRNGNARIERERAHRRPASISPKTVSSSIAVSPVATSTPASSTTRAVRPAGTSCNPAP